VAIGSGASGAAAMASIIWRNELVAVVSGAAVIVIFVVSRIFGHSELRLLASRLNSIARSFFHLNGQPRDRHIQSTVHFQGSREWDRVWTRLKEAALDLPVNKMELNLSAPMIQVVYHASWARRAADVENIWRFELPLMAAGHQIGLLRVAGERLPNLPVGALEKIVLLLEAFESQLETLFTQTAASGQAESIQSEPSELAKPRVLTGITEISAT